SRYLKKEYGIDGLTINTVHALQGAEKDIVIFSATYGGEDVKQKTLFYDTTRYLLNVAVSRAKESFIVFGDMSIFGRSPQQPSGKLKERLQPLPEHLAQVPEPTIEEMVSRMKGRVKTNKKVEKNVTIINNNNDGNVNIATDHSTLQVNEGAELSSQLIEDLRKEMSQVRQVSEKEKEEILQLLKALKQSKEKKEYKKMDRLLQRLRRWQPLFDGLNATGQTAANIMNIFK
nr:AAA domain-containing protein [Bacillota bacterium]